MKKLFLVLLLLFVISQTFAQNSFPQPQAADVTINSTVPSGHGYGYYGLWFPNATSLMAEPGTAYAGIALNSNVIRSSSYSWGFANSSLPAWQMFIGHGPSTDYFSVSRSSPNTYAMNSLLCIRSSGNVGIGTTTPKSLVEIQKYAMNAQGPIMELTNSGGYEGATSEIYFSTYNRDTGAPSARIKVADDGDWGGDFYFETKTPDTQTLTTKMFIDGVNGNVGIGTINPNTKLAVQGTVHATEVLVDQNVPQPDYVFDKEYNLATLKDVKAYIDQNHHLPEIPSTAQVAKEGINLGEMNTKLLKKIEELTLYLIQQKEDSDIQKISQQQQIDELTRQVKSLQNANKKTSSTHR